MKFMRTREGDIAVCPLKVAANFAAGRNAVNVNADSFACSTACAWCCKNDPFDGEVRTCGICNVAPKLYVNREEE